MNLFLAAPVFQNGDCTFLARVEFDGVAAIQSNIASITCGVFDLKGNTPSTPVATPSLVVANAIFNTLQTNPQWTRDAIGYNFLHAMPGTSFANARHEYDVIYTLTSSVGKLAYAKFRVTAEGTSY